MPVIKNKLWKKIFIPITILGLVYMAAQLKFLVMDVNIYNIMSFYKVNTKATILTDFIESHCKKVSCGESGSMKFIILAMTDNSFTDMAMNLYLSSFKRFNIENFLFVGGGKNACQSLKRLQIQCFDFWEDPDSNSSNSYGSKEFIRKMNIRTEMILSALHAGFSVLHTDLDVVFLQNPMPEIEELLKKNNMAIMWDHSAHNAGFLAIKATPFSIDVYTTIQSLTNASDSLDDQKALNRALQSVSESYKEKNFSRKITTLDKTKYLCGKDYFERNRNFPSADFKDNCPGCMVVHNNWIVGKEAKIYRFKETAMWFLDEEAYYSDKNRKYLMVYNPPLRNPPVDFEVREKETMALQTSLKVAAILNRTLILPRFHCQEKAECPFNSWFKVKIFHKEFFATYRESSFLLNDLVPESISMKPLNGCNLDLGNTTYNLSAKLTTFCNKQDLGSRSKCISFNPVPILILTKKNANISFYSVFAAMNTQPKPDILDLSNHDHLDQSVIMDKFGKCSDKVLVLASFLDVVVTFSYSNLETIFNNKLHKGLVRGSYMQF